MSSFADSDLLRMAEQRSVRISAVNSEGKHHNKSSIGVVIRTGYVLACEHVRGVDTEYFLNDKKAEIYYKETSTDLILFTCPTPNFQELRFDTNYKTGQSIFWFGDIFGENSDREDDDVKDFAFPGFIGKTTQEKVYTNIAGVEGFSGGAIWHTDLSAPIGLIMEYQREDLKLLIAISAEVINKFLKRAFNQPRHGNRTFDFQQTA